MHRLALALFGLVLTACTPESPGGQPVPKETRFRPEVAMRMFPDEGGIARYATIAARMEPVVEAECRARSPRNRCNFQFFVETHPEAPANAYQGENRRGQPIIAFTRKLLAELHNDDEIAFILGHEAAHHIRGHLPIKTDALIAGWIAGEVAARVAGANEEETRQAVALGGLIAISGFSKEFELEADALGAVITEIAGYDAITGARYFRRMGDPGHKYLGTHPPNAQRYQTVRRAVAGM